MVKYEYSGYSSFNIFWESSSNKSLGWIPSCSFYYFNTNNISNNLTQARTQEFISFQAPIKKEKEKKGKSLENADIVLGQFAVIF